MEQIKRANRLYTNDSIFLKKSLSIPVLPDWDLTSNGLDSAAGDDDSGCEQNGHSGGASGNRTCDGRERAADLTPEGFMKRLDELIHQSKEAAVRGQQEAEERYNLTLGCSHSAPCTRSLESMNPERNVSWLPYRAHEPTESAHRIRTRSNRGSKVSRFGSVPGLVFVCTESARIPSSPLLCLLSSSEERWSEGRGAFTVSRRNEQSVFFYTKNIECSFFLDFLMMKCHSN